MSSYFNRVPNFEYVSRTAQTKSISDYVEVKNLFKRAKLREDIEQNLSFYQAYNIIGDERPDQVAAKIYNDENLDWVVLLANNILNVQTEWPLPQLAFDKYVLEKYGSYENLYSTHHYETTEVRNSSGFTIVPAGLTVQQSYSVSYYDDGLGSVQTASNFAVPITNYEYEIRIENDKRQIFIIKPAYLNIVLDDMDQIMSYKEGSTQYVSESLKRADNIRLYE